MSNNKYLFEVSAFIQNNDYFFKWLYNRIKESEGYILFEIKGFLFFDYIDIADYIKISYSDKCGRTLSIEIQTVEFEKIMSVSYKDKEFLSKNTHFVFTNYFKNWLYDEVVKLGSFGSMEIGGCFYYKDKITIHYIDTCGYWGSIDIDLFKYEKLLNKFDK